MATTLLETIIHEPGAAVVTELARLAVPAGEPLELYCHAWDAWNAVPTVSVETSADQGSTWTVAVDFGELLDSFADATLELAPGDEFRIQWGFVVRDRLRPPASWVRVWTDTRPSPMAPPWSPA
jgi:hypothetical protein